MPDRADSSCPAGGAARPLRMRSARRVSRRELEACAAFPAGSCGPGAGGGLQSPRDHTRAAVARDRLQEPVTERGAEREVTGSEVSAARAGRASGLSSGSPGAAGRRRALSPGPVRLAGTSVGFESSRGGLPLGSPGPGASGDTVSQDPLALSVGQQHKIVGRCVPYGGTGSSSETQMMAWCHLLGSAGSEGRFHLLVCGCCLEIGTCPFQLCKSTKCSKSSN